MPNSNIKSTAVKDLMRPGLCYSREAIDSFLQYSRKSSDDGINTLDSRSRSCGEYIAGTLYQAWLSRDSVLNYCESVARSKTKTIDLNGSLDSAGSNATGSDAAGSENHVDGNHSSPPDSRLDPYGARDYNKRPPAPEQDMLDWISTQRNIENIIRWSSVKLLAEKCGTYSTDAQFFLDGYEQGIKGSLPRSK